MSGCAVGCAEDTNCCVLYRGKVYLRAHDEEFPRLVGNSSQLRLSHVEDGLTLLDGSQTQQCSGLIGVNVAMTLRCVGDANLALAKQGQIAQTSGTTVTKTFTYGSDVNPGSFLAFDTLADAATVTITASSGLDLVVGCYVEIGTAGLDVLRCISGSGTITVTYTSLDSIATSAGEDVAKDYELIYHGTNAFDMRPAVLRVPRVRFSLTDSFDWINTNEVGALALQGAVRPTGTSGKHWYTITRQDA
jgi:hypothetical protein